MDAPLKSGTPRSQLSYRIRRGTLPMGHMNSKGDSAI